jgi:DNA-binding PadR family transcriptional regulator
MRIQESQYPRSVKAGGHGGGTDSTAARSGSAWPRSHPSGHQTTDRALSLSAQSMSCLALCRLEVACAQLCQTDVAALEFAEYYTRHDARHGDVVSVPHALLALLSEEPKYGLQLREEFEAETGEVWPLNVGQVYKTLGRLERDGLAESDGTSQDGPQKRFRITQRGAEALATWLRTPPDMTSPPRDELLMKVLVAARVPGTDAHEVIQVHRVYLLELMQQWTRLKEGEARDDLSLALVVDAELFRLDAVIRWLDAADVRLARAAAEPRRPTPAAASVPQLRRLGARR